MMLLRVVTVFAVSAALAVMLRGSALAAAGNELTAEKEVHELGEAGDVIVKDALRTRSWSRPRREVDPNPLEFRTDLAIWTGIVFLVLLLVLWKFAWGPIASGLDQREQAVADQIAAAEKSNRGRQDGSGPVRAEARRREERGPRAPRPGPPRRRADRPPDRRGRPRRSPARSTSGRWPRSTPPRPGP